MQRLTLHYYCNAFAVHRILFGYWISIFKLNKLCAGVLFKASDKAIIQNVCMLYGRLPLEQVDVNEQR